jgi:hypothetical protein
MCGHHDEGTYPRIKYSIQHAQLFEEDEEVWSAGSSATTNIGAFPPVRLPVKKRKKRKEKKKKNQTKKTMGGKEGWKGEVSACCEFSLVTFSFSSWQLARDLD